MRRRIGELRRDGAETCGWWVKEYGWDRVVMNALIPRRYGFLHYQVEGRCRVRWSTRFGWLSSCMVMRRQAQLKRATIWIDKSISNKRSTITRCV